VSDSADNHEGRRGNRESGQALVEFALVLFPLVVFVGGIIQLGTGVARWHDLDRIANEGARAAAIQQWPGCPSTQTTCTGSPVCHPANPNTLLGRSLLNYLGCEAADAKMPGAVIEVCRPTASALVGDPITVKLRTRINFLSEEVNTATNKLKNKVTSIGVTLRGEATMRLEQTPSKYTPTPC
jgi:TadE-like protein